MPESPHGGSIAPTLRLGFAFSFLKFVFSHVRRYMRSFVAYVVCSLSIVFIIFMFVCSMDDRSIVIRLDIIIIYHYHCG